MSPLWFAIVSVMVSTAAVVVSWRALRAVPDGEAVRAALARLERGLQTPAVEPSDPLNPGALITRVQGATTKASAIAELNEYTTEVSRELEASRGLPEQLARLVFFSGGLLALLALLQAWAGDDVGRRVVPATSALGAALVGAVTCLQIGRMARARRQAFLQAARALSTALQARLPS